MAGFRRLILAAVALCFVVVVFGAYVRLSDAGLGCPDWPGCYGHLTVTDAAADAHKAWKEMIHRYLASTLGLLIVIIAGLSVRLRQQGAPRVLPWILVALVIFQGMLGMWTVTWQLKPLAVSGHLLGGLTTLSLLTWMWLSLRGSAATETRSPGLRIFATMALVALAVQIFLGGWTSSNYAALACPDFPTCHGSFWPEMDAREAFTLWRGLGINYEGGVLDNRARVTIHFAHRLGAMVVATLALLLALALLRSDSMPLRRFGIAIAAALALQIALGISIVKLQLPLLLADMHNAGAAVLLLTLVTLNHFLWIRTRP
jgi:cytochrome c oxidase assembly protein subunit 15